VARDAATELIPKQIRHAGQIIGSDAAAADPAAPTCHNAQRAAPVVGPRLKSRNFFPLEMSLRAQWT